MGTGVYKGEHIHPQGMESMREQSCLWPPPDSGEACDRQQLDHGQHEHLHLPKVGDEHAHVLVPAAPASVLRLAAYEVHVACVLNR